MINPNFEGKAELPVELMSSSVMFAVTVEESVAHVEIDSYASSDDESSDSTSHDESSNVRPTKRAAIVRNIKDICIELATFNCEMKGLFSKCINNW